MSGSRRVKRKREPTEAEKYLMEYHSAEVGKVKDYFQSVADSSVPEETGSAHILYYNAFLHHLMKIRIGGEYVEISPTEWARAFVQRDLNAAAEKLGNCILTPENIYTKQIPITELTKLIQKASAWIMTKFNDLIDPWSFPYEYITTDHVNGEIQAIEQDSAGQELVQTQTFQGVNLEVPQASFPEYFDLDAIFAAPDKYERIFDGFAKKIEQTDFCINAANMACALTRATIPTNTDIFVDAVQFSNNRWIQAAAPPIVHDIADIAVKISKTILFRLESQKENPVESANDFCPVKRLAIYRGAKFIHETYNGRIKINARGFDFDSETPEHNVFPTLEECDKIDRRLVEVGGTMFNKSATFAFPLNCQVLNGRSHSSNMLPANLGNPPSWGYNNISYSISGCSSHPSFNQVAQSSDPPSQSHQLDTVGSGKYRTCEAIQTPDNHFTVDLVGSGKCRTCEAIQTPDNHFTVVEIDGKTYSYTKLQWDTVSRIYKREKCLVKAGKALVKNLFTDEELRDCTPSGKTGPLVTQSNGPLDPDKQNKIMDTLKYLLENSTTNTGKTWNSQMEKELRTKVLTDTSSQIRRKLRSKSNC